jgi:DNA repair protein RecO (recombination protein O)
MRGILQVGTHIDYQWSARNSSQMGTVTIDHSEHATHDFLNDPIALSAMLSACALCDKALPEQERHQGLYEGLFSLLQNLNQSEIGCAVYVMWELALLKELGFGLDLTRCSGNGQASDLYYVSPKSGCAVSLEKGAPYHDRLLILPEFLKIEGARHHPDRMLQILDIYNGLKLTSYFLEHWVFAHISGGIPDARLRFQSLFAKTHHLLDETNLSVPPVKVSHA